MNIKNALSQLEKSVNEARENGWKGENSIAISISTMKYSLKFLEALPRDIPTPDVSAEPDGEIEFEWYKSKDRIFSVSVSNDSTISCAGRTSNQRKFYRFNFVSDTLPPTLIKDIRSIYN